MDGDKNKNIKSFLYSKTYSVLIIGYERLRTCMKELKDAQPPIDLIVCDEGHRLKSKDAKTTKMFEQLATPRRIILSGTPIQNDLSEFYAMVDFVCPNLLGDRSTFRRVFEEPITRSRVQGCSSEVLKVGRERSSMLQELTKDIILRRTADLLSDYLKPKTEMVVFCAPSPVQLRIYEQIVGNKSFKSDLRAGNFSNPLPYILTLRKLCNAPALLRSAANEAIEGESSVIFTDECQDLIAGDSLSKVESSGKLVLLEKLIKKVKRTTDDKMVIVSNFTKTLDVIESLADRRGWSCLRLDGKTKTETRQELVNEFNRTSQEANFLFLLSAKSGGVGLNLIGANRLVLFDSDWNPSTDKQAMARIHRDGQKKDCFIYRLLLAGTMDEKIYQRQLSKIGLSDSLMDSKTTSGKASDTFSPEELKDIFTLHQNTPALTHDLLHCECDGGGDIMAKQYEQERNGEDSDEEDEAPAAGFVAASEANVQELSKASRDKRAKLSALFSWSHFDCSNQASLAKLRDRTLAGIGAKQISASQESRLIDLSDANTSSVKQEPSSDSSDPMESDEAAQEAFHISKVPAGALLHVFEKNSRKMAVVSPVESDEE